MLHPNKRLIINHLQVSKQWFRDLLFLCFWAKVHAFPGRLRASEGLCGAVTAPAVPFPCPMFQKAGHWARFGPILRPTSQIWGHWTQCGTGNKRDGLCIYVAFPAGTSWTASWSEPPAGFRLPYVPRAVPDCGLACVSIVCNTRVSQAG